MNRKKLGQGILGLVLIGQMILITYETYSASYQLDYRTTTAVIWAVLAALIMIPYTATKVMSGAMMAKGVGSGSTSTHFSPRERIKQKMNYWQRNRPAQKYNRTRRMQKKRKIKSGFLWAIFGFAAMIAFQTVWTVITADPLFNQTDIIWNMDMRQIGTRMGYLLGSTYIIPAVIKILFHGCGLYIWNTQHIEDDKSDDEGEEFTNDFEPSYVDDNASPSAVRAARASKSSTADDFEYDLPEDPTQPLRDLYTKNKISMREFEKRMGRVLERQNQRSANDNDEFSFSDPELESLLEERD